LPAVHVFSDEPYKATDEHTLPDSSTDDQPKARSPVPAYELSEACHWPLPDSEQHIQVVEY